MFGLVSFFESFARRWDAGARLGRMGDANPDRSTQKGAEVESAASASGRNMPAEAEAVAQAEKVVASRPAASEKTDKEVTDPVVVGKAVAGTDRVLAALLNSSAGTAGKAVEKSQGVLSRLREPETAGGTPQRPVPELIATSIASGDAGGETSDRPSIDLLRQAAIENMREWRMELLVEGLDAPSDAVTGLDDADEQLKRDAGTEAAPAREGQIFGSQETRPAIPVAITAAYRASSEA
ncbi:hypothetical protein [Jiella marina]|uniref:hypothetical protein n=1 Tax=Jiella sp. LLJ827 TaxID=2917712 RepID=UPI00210194D5|nr:hypothetical protein [Jiella sp. LLJ827]MCQ0987927.1 hypothetical protein [Jiella sp. LLJ827]